MTMYPTPVRTARVVGIAEMAVAADPDAQLVTYALGSCLGVCVYDPVAKVGGMLHVMLPSSDLDADRARANPCMFVDTGVPELFRSCYQHGAVKERIVVKVAGGSFGGPDEASDRFQIGKRNLLALRKLLWRNGLRLHAEDVGGARTSRTMMLVIESGDVVVKANGQETVL
jgi:chemotaxis protein CheD